VAGTLEPGQNPYGFQAMIEQGGPVVWITLAIMAIMSAGTWYIMIVKYLDQRAVLKQAEELDKKFWTANSMKEGAEKLQKGSIFRAIVEEGLRAQKHHDGKMTDKIDEHEWITMSLQRTVNGIGMKLQDGLAFLATTGSTAPFVGLFGTVVGIYRALVNIGVAGQASIDKVAGPVGEALIMTAIGLGVAVPAVIAYNWLIRRNKEIMETISNFSSDVHAFLVSGARVERVPAPTAAPAAPAAARK
jgi:biopolymer transport protein ExbB